MNTIKTGPDQNELRQKKLEEDRKAQEELRTLFKPVAQTIAKGLNKSDFNFILNINFDLNYLNF